MREVSVDPWTVVLCTTAIFLAFQVIPNVFYAFTTKKSKEIVHDGATTRFIGLNERGKSILFPKHGDIIEMSVRESQFAIGAARNGGYVLSLGMTLTHHTGPIDIKTIESALNTLQRLHPFLRCKVTEYNGVIALEVDDQLQIPVIAVPSTETSIELLWSHHRNDKLRAGEALFRVLWVHSAEKTHVVFMAHHAVSDGRSLSALAHDFLLQLENPNQNQQSPLPLVPSCDTVAKRAMFAHPWQGLVSFWRTVASAVRGRGSFAFPIDASQEETFIKLSHNKPIGLTTHLTKEMTVKLLKNCKSRGVSVTACLGAALLHACADMNTTSCDKFTLGTVADGRMLEREPVSSKNVSLFATALPIFPCKIIAGLTSLWDTAEAYGRHLAQCTAHRDGVVVGLIIGYRMKKMMRAPQLTLGRPTIILSSSGILPHLQTKYGDKFTVSHAHVTSNQLYSFPKVSASTLGNILTLNFDGVFPIIRREDMETLREKTLYHLEEITRTDGYGVTEDVNSVS